MDRVIHKDVTRYRVVSVLALFAMTLLVGLPEPVLGEPGKPSTARFARVLQGGAPRTLEELKEIQRRIQALTDKIIPATVAIQVERANGSGVIIDDKGHVLTAAHVAGHPGRRATIHMADGSVARGVTLGLNQKLDSGLIRITDKGPWPFAPLGTSSDVKEGQWCLATGHPGGYNPDRPPVLRWGRILRNEEAAILTDCTLVGGDSGGPLFDLHGRVIGIHSRIGKNLTVNVHVPVDPFVESWDRLVRGEVWGLLTSDELGPSDSNSQDSDVQNSESNVAALAWLGVIEDRSSPQARIRSVAPDSPAAQAGIQAGDIVERIGDTRIRSFSSLQREVRSREPGERVRVQVRRNDSLLPLRVQLGSRPRIP